MGRDLQVVNAQVARVRGIGWIAAWNRRAFKVVCNRRNRQVNLCSIGQVITKHTQAQSQIQTHASIYMYISQMCVQCATAGRSLSLSRLRLSVASHIQSSSHCIFVMIIYMYDNKKLIYKI